MERFEMRRNYWEESQRVREAFARDFLSNVLLWAFEHEELLGQDDEDLEDFFFTLQENLGHIVPPWKSLMDELRHAPMSRMRGDFTEALTAIRAIARDVAAGTHATDPWTMRIELSLSDRTDDTDDRPSWRLRGRFADAVVWMGLKLFSEVPRSVVRLCGMAHCERVFVGTHNQRYCAKHQDEARRRAAHRAMQAFRARQRTRKPKARRGR